MRGLCALALIFVLLACIVAAEERTGREPIGLAAYTLKRPGFEWITQHTDPYRIHFDFREQIASIVSKPFRALADTESLSQS